MTPFFKRISVVLNALMVLITAMSANASQSEKQIKTINIGIYAPFTSKSAYIGRNMLGAMEIARDELQSSEINYEFYTLDQRSNSVDASRVLQKFIEIHHIHILLTKGSNAAQVAAPLARKNKLIHFSLGNDADVADGKNNFQTHNPNYQYGSVLTKSPRSGFVKRFQEEYFSHPVTEAGYAYDVFQVLHRSVVLALNSNSTFSSQAVAAHFLALESGVGVMGRFRLNQKGVSYKKEIVTV